MSESKKARKKVAKKLKPLNISTEGKFLAVLEEMRDEIKIIAEGHSILARGIDELKDKMGSMEKRMDGFDGELKEIRNEMAQGFRMVFDYVERIEDEIKDVKKEIEILRKELKSKADVQRLEILEKRVQRIERDYAVIMDKGEKKYKTQ
ncbi:MAG: hypothetical protein Athens071425_526 [Parcubacteria group bacterium Athens0714_25]|nr:MAG: hypothetical protein Athens071425_526 [Parcubacteria group bacterium Athens0714_25]